MLTFCRGGERFGSYPCSPPPGGEDQDSRKQASDAKFLKSLVFEFFGPVSHRTSLTEGFVSLLLFSKQGVLTYTCAEPRSMFVGWCFLATTSTELLVLLRHRLAMATWQEHRAGSSQGTGLSIPEITSKLSRYLAAVPKKR